MYAKNRTAKPAKRWQFPGTKRFWNRWLDDLIKADWEKHGIKLEEKEPEDSEAIQIKPISKRELLRNVLYFVLFLIMSLVVIPMLATNVPMRFVVAGGAIIAGLSLMGWLSAFKLFPHGFYLPFMWGTIGVVFIIHLANKEFLDGKDKGAIYYILVFVFIFHAILVSAAWAIDRLIAKRKSFQNEKDEDGTKPKHSRKV